jgi:hypothetical protein
MTRAYFPLLAALLVAAFAACGDAADETLPATTPALSATPTLSAQPASPITAWTTYSDSATGFDMPIPENTSRKEQTIEFPEKGGYPAVLDRLISFVNQAGDGVVGVGVTPNPAGLTLEDWIRTYPGWPGDPTTIQIAEEQGLRFSRSVLDEPADDVFFQHGGYIFELSGGVYGSAEGGNGPTITKSDFDRVISEFHFHQ